jgi:long-chain acyl-CoA synthetase
VTLGALDDALTRSAATAPERTSLRAGDRELSYRRLEVAAATLASGLADLGVRRGDRVAIALPNGIDAAVAIYATLRAGAVIVPLNPRIKPAKLARILSDCSAAMLVCEASLAETGRDVLGALPHLRVVIAGRETIEDPPALHELTTSGSRDTSGAIESDLAAIIYTSGSSGAQKGVMLTHRNMTFATASITRYLEMTGDDRVLSVLPLAFDYGLYQLFLAVEVGATLLLEPNVGYPGRLVRLMIEQEVTGLPGVPTLFNLLLTLPGFADRDWPHVRFLTNTGAALGRKTIQRLRDCFQSARLYSMYGLTECKRVSYLPPRELDARPDSVGIPIPGTEAWIENAAGERVGPGQVGELMVHGPHVMQGYWNDPIRTRARLRAGRWPWTRTLATGDLFSWDDDGFLYFAGRSDDLIKSRGEKVYPREVEDVLRSAPGVLEAVVFGLDDERLGQAVCAAVASEPGHLLDVHELRRYCHANLEDHLVPLQIDAYAELPRTANGKIDRDALISNARQAAASSALPDETRTRPEHHS